MRAAALVVFVLVVAAVPAAGSALGAGGTAAAATADEGNVTVAVTVEPDGHARWTVSAAFALGSENETEAFRELAREFEAGEGGVGFSAATFRTLADRASERTGRPMAVEDVSRSSAISNGTGVVTLSLTWTNFTRADGELLRVGDAFPRQWDLAADQRLVVYPPTEYTASNVRPGPDRVQDGGLVWGGPQSFDSGPRISYEPSTGGTPTTPATTTTTATTTDATTTQPPDGDRNAAATLGILGALVVAVAGLWLYLNRSREPDEGDDTAVEQDGTATPAPENEDEERDAEGGAAEPVEELLSDEERVERLLAENDGRMRQADIVETTDWSNAKVSQLLSSMAEDGRVEKLRMGRENVISLPDDDER